MNSFLRTFQTAVLLAMALFGVVSCGGGDETSNEAPIAITFDTRNFVVNVPAGSNTFSSVTASLSSVPSGTVYATLQMDRPVLRAGTTVITRNANGSYTGTFQIEPSLAVGRYTGAFTLLLCKDAACSSTYPLSGAVLPYDINVVPAISLSVTKNGAPASPNGMYYPLQMGDQIVVTSSMPTTWVLSAIGGGSASGLTSVAQTSTTWQATVTQTGASVQLRATSTTLNSNIQTLYFSIF